MQPVLLTQPTLTAPHVLDWMVGLAVMLTAGSLPATPWRAADTAAISLSYAAVMDMVRPEAHRGIVVHHALRVTVSDHGNLSENRARSTRHYSDQNRALQVLGSTGDQSTYTSWQVAPDGRLMRIRNDPQSTRTVTVTLMSGRTCRLEVADRLKAGFTEYAFLRISTHSIGYFSSYKVTRTSCTMH